jgi:hypothetical protein
MIDWTTGRFAANAEFSINNPGYYFSVARTNAQGHFQVTLPFAPAAYFLSPASARYGTLLQTRFARSIVVLRKGEKFRNIALPAIPSTEVSGHIYDSKGYLLSGCYVPALTREDVNPRKSVSLDRWGPQESTYGSPGADDPNKFLDAEQTDTGQDGSFQFTRLGADRYFLLTRCHNASGTSWWEPAFYPSANSLKGPREILLRRASAKRIRLPSRPQPNVLFRRQASIERWLRAKASGGHKGFARGTDTHVHIPWQGGL